MSATLFHSLAGWSVGCAIGLALALLGSLWTPSGLALRPVATALLGLPPVAWLVLAALWFGADGSTPGSPSPCGRARGLCRGDPWPRPARSRRSTKWRPGFARHRWQKFTDILAPQIFSHFLPAAATALGLALKVCVMSEVMASGTGIGGQLAARARQSRSCRDHGLDPARRGAGLILDLALIEPFRRLFRPAPAPAGA